MQKPRIALFDTTLRDGTQGEKISFSADDKVRIAERLDDFGIQYIEGGWPGSNPKDMIFFDKVRNKKFKNARIVAFGSTHRADREPEDDANLQALINAGTKANSIFGKSWLLHVTDALHITPEENLKIIYQSVDFLKKHDREVIYDAEHFFDGYKDNPSYAIETLLASQEGGADVIVLCDTNGGTLPDEIARIVKEVGKRLDTPLGIHAHNDGELAVANSLAAVNAGCIHVQGTINGYGERCGNANLCSIAANLQLKLDYPVISDIQLKKLTSLSRFVSEVANLSPDNKLPFVGSSAFAHKGGVHVSAVMKNATTYEHLEPECVGNHRRVLVSDLSGKSNVLYKSDELGFDLDTDQNNITEIVQKLKELENDGYQYEAAEASFELLVRRMTKHYKEYFKLEGFRVIIEKDGSGNYRSEATIRLNVNGQKEHSACEGNGPVNALDGALRKALNKFYPQVNEMHLTDYKVRVLNGNDGTNAKVRVLIESGRNEEASWGTIGVSPNIIDASWQALSDSFSFYLQKHESETQKEKNHAKAKTTIKST